MAFGQQAGPPATRQQVQELLELRQAAGHADFRDARGPLGFSQRQAGGKFTRDEASGFIDALQAEAELGAAADAATSSAGPSTPAPRAAPRPSRAELALRSVPDALLAAELQRRGWVVMEP